MKYAVLMGGFNMFARILLDALAAAGRAPDLVINESGTARAKRLESWLCEGAALVPTRAAVQAGADFTYVEVDDFHGPAARGLLADLDPDYVVNGGCGIIKADFLQLPKHGFLNAHPGLLPEFRGVDPVLWSIARGAPLGATVHVMTEGIDQGPILLREPMALPNVETLVELRVACMRHGAALMARVLGDPAAYPLRPQCDSKATYFGPFPEADYARVEEMLRMRVRDEHGDEARRA